MDEQKNEQNNDMSREADSQTYTKSKPFDNYVPSQPLAPKSPAAEPAASSEMSASQAEAQPTGGWSADAIDSSPAPMPASEQLKPSAAAAIYPAPARPAAVFDEPAAGGASATPSPLTAPEDDRPIPVVKVLSVRGVEYAMMSILLWVGAGALITILVTIVYGGASFRGLSFPISLLLVCMPGFAWFYLRLRQAELANPSLRLEPSKRRFSQITQILAFITCFSNVVALVYTIVGMLGGNEVDSLGKLLGSIFVTLLVAGGILAYYWADEHKLTRD